MSDADYRCPICETWWVVPSLVDWCVAKHERETEPGE